MLLHADVLMDLRQGERVYKLRRFRPHEFLQDLRYYVVHGINRIHRFPEKGG